MSVERGRMTGKAWRRLIASVLGEPEVSLTAGVQSTRGGLVEEGAAMLCPDRPGRALYGSDGLKAGKRQIKHVHLCFLSSC